MQSFNFKNPIKVKKNGVYKKYYDDGKIRAKANYKEDKLHGEQIGYYEDGKIFF